MRPLTLRATDALSDCGRSCSVSQELSDEISAALECARVVGVLDAWALAKHGRSVELVATAGAYPACIEVKTNVALTGRDYFGITPDAARAAAAKAIESGEV